jgi:hypothetical protein
MKIIKPFIKIVHTKYIYIYIYISYYERKKKTSIYILRVMLRPARPEGVPSCHGSCLDRRKDLPCHIGMRNFVECH